MAAVLAVQVNKTYAFRGWIPRKSGVGAADFVLNNDPIAAGAIGEECSTKDVVLTSALPGIDPLNAYNKTDFIYGEEKEAA